MEVWRKPDIYNCNNCGNGRYCDESKEWPGSSGPAPYPKFVIEGVIESNVCFKPMISAQTHLLSKLHQHYKNGHMWYPDKGPYEQPNVYLKAMELLDTLNANTSSKA